jgi:hypothetical protein
MNLETLKCKIKDFRKWLRLGPVETQLCRDLRATVDETESRLEQQESIAESGDAERFQSASVRFRNFLSNELGQAEDRMGDEMEYIRSAAGDGYHSRIVEEVEKAHQVLDEEAVRLSNALRQAEQRIDRGDDPQKVFQDLLEIEQDEESQLRQADRNVSAVEEIVEQNRLDALYRVKKRRDKLEQRLRSLV